MGNLYVFGDSHSLIWGGVFPGGAPPNKFDRVKVHHLGPALAYNLINDSDDLGKYGQKILDILIGVLDCDAVMLCFGEIDIRTRVILNAHQNSTQIEEETIKIADRLLLAGKLISLKLSKPIFLWGPLPSQPRFANQWNISLPTAGTEFERNYSTQIFNEHLKNSCANSDCLYFFSVFDSLVDPFLISKKDFLPDGCHLSYPGLELAIASFNNTIKINNLDLDNFFINKSYSIKNIRKIDYFVANIIPYPAPQYSIKKSQTSHSSDHILKIDTQYVRYDLGYGSFVKKISFDLPEGFTEDNLDLLFFGVGIDPLSYEGLDIIVVGNVCNIILEKAYLVRYLCVNTSLNHHINLNNLEVYEETLINK